MNKENGWSVLPLSLKILSGFVLLWAIGSLFAVSMRYELGVPFFGLYVYGIVAAGIVILLDVVGPFVLLYAFGARSSWTVSWASLYIGIFCLNSLVALFTVLRQFSLGEILMPMVVNLVFLLIVYWNRDYFG